jgi:hypothetical protein
MTPDLAARRLLMAALLYYEFSTNVMSDHEYDALGIFVKDNFNHLSDTMKFCIGEDWPIDDGLSWTASGAKFKYTRRLFYGALAWADCYGLRVENRREWKMVDYDLETGIVYDQARG